MGDKRKKKLHNTLLTTTRPLVYLIMNAKSFLFAAIIVALIGGAILVFSQPSAAPQVRFVTLQGEQVTMDSLRGKVVLVNFWATSCPGCIKEMPALVNVYNKYHEQGLEIIAVAMNYDPPNYVLNYTKNHALPFKVALDVQGNLARAFNEVKLTPTTFIIDKRGNVIQQTTGELDFPKLYTLLERELAVKAAIESHGAQYARQ